MILKASVRLVTLGAAMLLLAACGAEPTPTPSPTPTLAPGVTPTATPTVTPDPRSPFEIEWDELVVKAQEEGRLDTILSNLLSRAESSKALTDRFESEFGIKMTANITGSSSQTWERISAERKAGKYTIDVWTGGYSTSSQLIRPGRAMIPLKNLLIHPEVLDESAWLGGRFPWLDPEQEWTMNFIGRPDGSGIAYNTDLVNDEDLAGIKSYYDLFDPRWEGQIVVLDFGVRSQPLEFMWAVPALGKQFMTRLHDTATIVADARQAVDLLADGAFALCPWCSSSEVRSAEAQGLPVKNLVRGLSEGERLSLGGHTLMAIDRPPHPNAQKLFVNWLLTKDAMQFVQEITEADSMRIDIPKDVVHPEERRVPGRDYVFIGVNPNSAADLREAIDFWRGLRSG